MPGADQREPRRNLRRQPGRRRDARSSPSRRGRLPRRRVVRRNRLRPEHDVADVRSQPGPRQDVEAGRRGDGHAQRSRRQRLALAAGCPRCRRDGSLDRHRSRNLHARSRHLSPAAQRKDEARRRRPGIEPGRHHPSCRDDRTGSSAGRCADVRRRRPLCAARADLRPRARLRLPRLLRVQVLRPSRRHPVGSPGAAGIAGRVQGPARPRRAAGQVDDRHAESRRHRRHPGRGRVL